mmetsp:Transcript_13539/g.14595  ORF Transcript_13539/g.14595 Transcript_13539/m.14595 type:complete len:80 (-) Transcript_13539:985-1224(-)
MKTLERQNLKRMQLVVTPKTNTIFNMTTTETIIITMVMVMVICGDDGRLKRRGKKIKTSLNDLIVIVIVISIIILLSFS